uniref:Uncharacterized protein n=1 Tax=Candidatus Kentrum sp. LFY TaxID=2126342 RepID=A0A450X0L7_9GAMM|nr:MAG: hypothetical protein BECKLFY1418C_GA0070996_11278 [Candidatus Kentron sp. LFY]
MVDYYRKKAIYYLLIRFIKKMTMMVFLKRGPVKFCPSWINFRDVHRMMIFENWNSGLE